MQASPNELPRRPQGCDLFWVTRSHQSDTLGAGTRGRGAPFLA